MPSAVPALSWDEVTTTAESRPALRARVLQPSLAALVVVTGVGPFAVDTYLAALPDVERSLGTTAAVAQLTVTAFIVGNALGQLLLGPLSDGRGRRHLLLAGAVVFTVASLASAFAPSGPILVVARLLQGLAAGGGISIGRAVVGDTSSGDDAARRYSTLAAINFLAPVIAPAVGGGILTVGSWRTVFLALTALGLLQVATVLFGVPETLDRADVARESGLRPTVRRMADLLRDAAFMRIVVVQCLATAGFFVYIGGSSFVLETVYALTPAAYATLFAVNALAMAASSGLVRMLVGRVAVPVLRGAGLALSCTGAVALAASAVVAAPAAPPLALVWGALTCVVGGMGLVIPATTALAQEAGRRALGTASALQGGLAFLAGAAVTPLTGIVGYDSVLPMGLLMGGFFVAAAVTVLLPSRRVTARRVPA
jgi:DHA1 family bicyclomycin/chloramphenicol resistance-like MFS transporter